MQQASYPSRRLRFGVFEADLRTGQLAKNGKRVRVQEQPFRLLAMLLEKPGEMVAREELRRKLWPQTTVDFDHGLNKAVSKLRDALGDSAENPRFIETVASRGYRFLADVAVMRDGEPGPVSGNPATQVTPGLLKPPHALTSTTRPRRTFAWTRLGLVLALVLAF